MKSVISDNKIIPFLPCYKRTSQLHETKVSDLKTVYGCNGYAVYDYTENAFAYQALIAYQPNKKKLAIGNQYGEGISFYNMNNILHPQLLKEYMMTPPHYIDASKGDRKSVTFQKDNICGFVDIGASEKYCIGLFLGQARVKGEAWRGGDKLLIFDWDGNPVKKIDLPQKYLQMAISDDKIILLGHDPKTIDFVVHTIDLSEI